MPEAPVRGHFLWHELMTSDPAAALLFYPRVVGWAVREAAHDPSYSLLTFDEVPRAGVLRLPEEASAAGMPPSWLSYIGTSDVDETVRRAAALGASVLRAPTDVPGLSRFAILRDPQGAPFAAFAPRNGASADSESARGGFSWHELATSDGEAAWEFYAALFGWEKTEAMDMGPMGTYQMFGWGNRSLGGIYTLPRDLEIASSWLPYAEVDDSRRASSAVEAGGGRVVSAPMQVPGGSWVAKMVDPQGAVFAVHSLAVSAPATAPEAPAAAERRRRPASAAKRVTTRTPPRRAKGIRKAASKPARKRAASARPKASRSKKRRSASVAKRKKPRAASVRTSARAKSSLKKAGSAAKKRRKR
jgi:predicted enzyme related to lactoylglutathione lyase